MVILTIASISQIDAGCEIGKVTNKDIKKLFEPYTVMKKPGKPKNDSPCWWDLTRKNCGTCKKGGKQCGYPMHKWCQSPKSKKGCKGIPNSKYIFSIVYTILGVDKEPHVQRRLRPVVDVLVTPNTLEMVFNASLEIVMLAIVL